MGRIRPVAATEQALAAACAEENPRRAVALFAACLGLVYYEAEKPSRYDEFSGQVKETRWVPSAWPSWDGEVPQDCPLGRYLAAHLPEGAVAVVDGAVVEHVGRHTEAYSEMGHSGTYTADGYFRVRRVVALFGGG